MEPNLLGKLNDVTLGNGSTGRFIPNDVSEQIFLREVLDDPLNGADNLTEMGVVNMSDPRWPADEGWVKMQVSGTRTYVDDSLNVVSGNSTIPFNYNTITGEFDDFKFK